MWTRPGVTSLALALALTAGSARVARAHFVLYLQGESGSYVENGIKRFTDGDGPLDGFGTPATGASLAFHTPGYEQWFYLDFAAPAGSDLVPGEYSGATRRAFAEPGTPGLDVRGNGMGCNTLTGSFVVHEVVFAPPDRIVAFSADFEQHCDGQVPALRGSLRWRTGDATCAAAPPDAPCDDGDACTAADHCVAGSCTGSFVAPPSCDVPPAPCTGPSACAPLTGDCAPGPPADGLPCDDANACTSDDRCTDGVCAGIETTSCDDADPCTLDGCDAIGCTHAPLEGCWPLAGTARVTACAGGRCARRSSHVDALIVIAPDGTFAKPNGRCPTGGALLPDEVGSWTQRHDGRLVLETTNLDDVLTAFAGCADIDPYLVAVLRKGRRNYRQVYEVLQAGDRAFCRWARNLPADGRHICGQQTVHATLRVRGVAVRVGIRWRLAGPVASL